MPAELIKLFITASSNVTGTVDTTTTTEVSPDSLKFVAIVTAGMVVGDTTTIPATSFLDDNGDPVAALPTPAADNVYNVYINGVLQQAGLSVITPAQVTISAPVPVGVPVVLELDDFADVTSTSTSTTNLDVDTTIST
ncbi:hypothetical protein AS180_11390 [Priestia veravalensis]|uniref:DUF4183 domain-containing protein n=1 Tax=Priestia veravalensis TaxID=1414648 RepID=A0A0V8JL91_9BACI|nr:MULTISPECIES: DUF4183 domain-containing protein [Priestia]KSU87811.1 hypothetical protein AS180_11390 [Priestia veravalensis]SCC29516.1 protein of unknown function [Priestia flexa]